MFLDRETQKKYASLDIPYRRGYLFSGPPGTGKTSLSVALAGLFGLDIYVIPLFDNQITDSDLKDLFTNLPEQCMVLLGDIDAEDLSKPRAASNNNDHQDLDSHDVGVYSLYPRRPKDQATPLPNW